MKAFYTIALLVISNVFMTLAWYGHLKFKDWNWFPRAGLLAVILISWSLAFFEYMFQVPANRLGYQGHGGPFSLVELKVLQEAITLLVFSLLSVLLFRGEVLRPRHLLAFACLLLAVYFTFRK